MAEELSWGKAFRHAVRYILYMILWIIIGGVIIVAGAFVLRTGIRPGPLGPFGIPTFKPGPLIMGGIIIVVGYVILALGSMATYFKIMSRVIRESTS